MAIFSGLRRLYGAQIDPARVAAAQAFLPGADAGAADMAQQFRQLQADLERLRTFPPGERVQLAQAASPRGRAQGGPMRGTVEGVHAQGRSGPWSPVAEIMDDVRNRTLDAGRAAGAMRARISEADKLREGLNGVGYFPQEGDADLLARIIYSESHEIPGDDEAIGWSTINRIGREGFQPTLIEALHAPGQFAIVAEGNPEHVDHSLWTESARPEALRDWKQQRWIHARKVAEGILSGVIPDPTGGATRFFASTEFDPNDVRSAPRSYRAEIRSGRIRPSKYVTAATGRNRQYFWVEAAPPRPLRPRR